MLTEPNTRLIKVRFQPRYDEGDSLSARGEANYLEKDFETLFPRWRLVTWVDFQVSRKATERGRAIDIDAVWELKQAIIDKIAELLLPLDRVLQIGDLVQFSYGSNWYAITSMDKDEGIFGGIPMWRIHLKKSLKSGRKCT